MLTCVREAARHTEGTSGVFLAASAASCAVQTTRHLVQVRVHVRVRVRVRHRCALRPRTQRPTYASYEATRSMQ